MNDIDNNLKTALADHGEFDPDRARPAQEAVFREYKKKLVRSERIMWLLIDGLIAVFIYCYTVFNMQASTPKEWIASGLICLGIVLIMIQKTILFNSYGIYLATMKEVRQLRIAMVNGDIPPEETAAKPLRGMKTWERALWFAGLIFVSGLTGSFASRVDRQDDVWRLLDEHANIEAVSTLTLTSKPHRIPSFYSLEGPVPGATLDSVRFNGDPVDFRQIGDLYNIKLPSKSSWGRDKLELKWAFDIGDLKQTDAPFRVEDLRAPLRSLVPVHGYSLTLILENNDDFVARDEDAWRFNKSSRELANEAEARNRLKLFSIHVHDGGPRSDFGTCGLPLRDMRADPE